MYRVISGLAWSIVDENDNEQLEVTEKDYAEFLCALMNEGKTLQEITSRPHPDREFYSTIWPDDQIATLRLMEDVLSSSEPDRNKASLLVAYRESDPLLDLRREALIVLLSRADVTNVDILKILHSQPVEWPLDSVVCNRTYLNKLIQWSSSRYNEYKKVDVIDSIQFMVESGADETATFHSGCYSEAVHTRKTNCQWTGGTYTITVAGGIGLLYSGSVDVNPSGEGVLLLPPAKPTLYTGATQVRLCSDYFISFAGEYEVLDESAHKYSINNNGQKSLVPKRICEVLESRAYSVERFALNDTTDYGVLESQGGSQAYRTSYEEDGHETDMF